MSQQYSVILADPPWQYRVFKPGSKRPHVNRPGIYSVAVSYQTMTTEELRALPVADMATKNCALFMWATMPCLPDAINIMEAWGFTYKTVAFTWVKTTKERGYFKGMGHYTMANAELCLLGIRGTMTRKAKGIAQIIATPRREHSRKPDEVYERIMRLFDGPYLEMFSRQQWPGWHTTFSNQSDKFPAQPFLIPESAVSA